MFGFGSYLELLVLGFWVKYFICIGVFFLFVEWELFMNVFKFWGGLSEGKV